ncbi:MAG: D-aminoacyl-tRNA deacylase [Candidatus Woesearchaeota archaeon]|nr:MAG: D-aminoacyl-tRNA deacylase [Candidatus Woesearchaeota archaeon]
MKTCIVVSTTNKASMNIYENLKRYNLKNVIFHLSEKEIIDFEDLDKEVDADLFIFASSHKSESNKKSLCIHYPGNWNKNEMGGKERQLIITNSSVFKEGFVELNKLAKGLDYEVSTEADHHGPYLEKPAIFVEVGSTEKEYEDKKAGDVLAKVIAKMISNDKEYDTVMVFGGLHYNMTANKLLLNTNYAVSHICPKYRLEDLDEEIVKQALEKSVEKISFVVLDWKGLGKAKDKVLDILNKLSIKYERYDKI